jgi:hypothetical protein
MERVMTPAVVPPPTHAMVIWRRALAPSPATITRRMIYRTSSLRSACVVVGGCQRAGMLWASCAMADHSAADRGWGCPCTKPSYASCRWAVRLASESLASSRATKRCSGATRRS